MPERSGTISTLTQSPVGPKHAAHPSSLATTPRSTPPRSRLAAEDASRLDDLDKLCENVRHNHWDWQWGVYLLERHLMEAHTWLLCYVMLCYLMEALCGEWQESFHRPDPLTCGQGPCACGSRARAPQRALQCCAECQPLPGIGSHWRRLQTQAREVSERRASTSPREQRHVPSRTRAPLAAGHAPPGPALLPGHQRSRGHG